MVNIVKSVLFHRLNSLFGIWAATVCVGILLAPRPAQAQQKLDRPQIKSISAPAYYPGGGIGFTMRVADDLAYLNVNMMRVEIIGEFDATKTINYSAYDYIVDQAGERGVKVLGLVDYQSVWYANQSEWATADFRARYVQRLSELVQHYHNRAYPIRHWEIWNEEDIALPEFNVRIDPEPYAQILIESYAAVKAIDPGATVVLGGISPKGLYYGQNYLNDLYNTEAMQDYYTANNSYPFDVVAVHPYPEIFSNPNPGLRNALNTHVKSVMNNHSDRAKKVWLTEMGWSSYFVTETQQANYLRDSFLLVDDLVDPVFTSDLPYVDQYFWFQYRDFSPIDKWGLYNENLSRRKPSFTAYLNLTDAGPEPPPVPGPEGDSPVFDATSDSALPVQVSAEDLLHGKTGEIISGGFHPSSEGTIDALTNGFFDSNGMTLIAQDYGAPALGVRYEFDEAVHLTEVRTFAGHFGAGGDRAFQAIDIYINGELAVNDMRTGPYGQVSQGSTAVSVLRWLPESEQLYVAKNVTSLEVAFYCVTAIEGGFRDRWSPIDDPDLDKDGADAAYVAPIIKEIDALGVPASFPDLQGWMFY